MNHMLERLILGTVQFGLHYGINNKSGQISTNEAFQILDYAWLNGVRTLDTAAAYGSAESIIGQYLDARPDRSFQLITKLGLHHTDDLEQALFESLGRLKTQSVQTILFHSIQDYKKFKEQLLRFSNRFKGSRFNQIGVSAYTNDEMIELSNEPGIDVVQMPFNLLDNSVLRQEAMQRLKQAGIAIHTRSMFLQGLIFKPLQEIPKGLDPLKPALLRITEIARKYNYTIEQLAFLYAMQSAETDGVLMGIDSISQLKQNLSYICLPLERECIDEIHQIQIPDSIYLNPSKWHELM
jgi:aryl-alcohol dehydrogenase-like predicted oxidoreductase